MDSYSVEAILTARDAGFKTAFDQANRSVQNMERNSKSFGSSIKSSFAFGAIVRAGGKAFDFACNQVKSLVGELSSSQATWKTFEGNMKNFGKSGKQIKKVRGELQDFATKTIYSASDMATTYSQLEAVGIKGTANLVKGFGGLAAAAENPQQAMKTLSQQATQMAAKPTVQWMDFKLMLEQTPAGIAAVAKTMGKSTSELVKDVQDGKVKTEEFFDAIKKTAGEGTKFGKMATEYKTVGQAMDGLTETLTTKLQPSFDKVSEYGIKAVEKMTGMIDKIDGEKVARLLSGALDKAVPMMENLFKKITPYAISAGKTLVEFGKAAFDVGRSIVSNRNVMSTFKTVLSAVGNAIKQVSGFISSHKEQIAKLTPIILGVVAGFKLFKGVSGILGGVFGKSISPLLGGGLVATLKGLVMTFNMLQPQGLLSFAGSVAVVVGGLVALGATRNIILPFLSGLADVFGKLTTFLPPLVESITQGLAKGLVIIAPVASQLASAFTELTPLITAFGVAFSSIIESIGTAISTILPALAPVIESIGTAISSVIESMGTVVSEVATAITPMVSIIGSTIAQVIQILAPYIPNIQKMVEATASAISSICTSFNVLVSNLSGIINSITALVNALGTQICTIFTQIQNTITTFGDTVCRILNTFSTTVSTVLTSVGDLFTTFGTTVDTVLNSASNVISTVGDSIKTVLDGLAGVFDSIGNGALNAGTGVKNLASGIQKLVGTNLADLGASMVVVAKGLNSIAGTGEGLSTVSASLSTLATAAKTTASSLTNITKTILATTSACTQAGSQMGSGFANGLKTGFTAASNFAKTTVKAIASSLKSGASQAKAAGTQMGSGFASGFKAGASKAPGYAASSVSQVSSRVRAGYSSAYSAGYHIGSGVAAGLRSAAGSVESAASRIVSAANKAAQAKAKIHSPSKLTKEEVGKPLGQGVAAGLKDSTASVKKSAEKVVKAATKAMKKTAKLNTEKTKKTTKKSILTDTVKRLAKQAKSAKGYVNTALDTLKKSTSAANGGYKKVGETVQSSIKKNLETKQKESLKSAKEKIKKNSAKLYSKKDSKKATKLASTIYDQYEKYLKSETEKIVSASESSIKKITEKYQELYDKVIEKRTNFFNKLSTIGSLYTVDDYGYVALKDFKAATKEIQAYSANIEKLKQLLPDGLMEEILGMDTTQGLEYTNRLLKMSSSELVQYGKDYTNFINTATNASNKYYQTQLDTVKKQFDTAITTEMNSLQKQLDKLGQNAAQGFINGMAKKNTDLKKTAKKMGTTVSSIVKKILGIHSPSRVMQRLGRFTGQGFVNGLSDMRAEIRRAQFKLVDIPDIDTSEIRTSYSGRTLDERYDYSSIHQEIIVVSELDGREIARTIVDPMSEELDKKERRNSRKKGIA